MFEARRASEGAKPRHEAVLAASRDDEARQTMQPLGIGLRGIVNAPAPSWAPAIGSCTLPSPRNSPPLIHSDLHELELPPEMRSDEREHQPPIDAVVLEDSFRKLGPVGSAAADHSVKPNHARHRASRGFVRRMCEPGGVLYPVASSPKTKSLLRAGSAPSAGSSWSGQQRERRAAAPSPHHLRPRAAPPRRDCCACSLGTPERRHALVQLAKHDVGAVAAEHVGLWHRRTSAGLVGVAEDELARLERWLVWIGAGDPLPSMAGWPMLSRKPNGSCPSRARGSPGARSS